MDKQLFLDAMSQLAAGVTIVASNGPAGKAGITATSVVSVTASPPTMLACINTNTELASKIQENGYFSIQVLAESQEGISNVFAGVGGLNGKERFTQGTWNEVEEQQLVLEGATGHFVCRVSSVAIQGTHLVVFGEVISANAKQGTPLLYYNRDYRKLMSGGGG